MMNWIVSNRLSLHLLLPETILGAGAILTLLIEAYKGFSRKGAMLWSVLVFGLYLAASTQLTFAPSSDAFAGMIAVDALAVFFKVFFGVVAILVSLLVYENKDLRETGLAEIFAALMVVTIGLSMMASASDLLMMILSIEMVSVLSYVLVGFRKQNRASSEAGLKYLLYGAVASGIMAFGLSFIFGLVGSSSLSDIRDYFHALNGIETAPIVLFALLTVMVGIGYKISTFPAHMWCPDVYEGAPLAVTTFLSVAPKAAGFAMLARFTLTPFVQDAEVTQLLSFVRWPWVLSLLAILTMTLGNLGALAQTNLKRLMAYSSIAHAGYLLMGIAVFSTQGIEAICFYLVAYLLMNLGAFYIVSVVSEQRGTESIDALKGLGWTSPWISALFGVFLFSLIGLPPCAGFIGKFLLFSAVIQKKLYILAAFGVLNTAVALFYYARLLKTMYFESSDESAPAVRLLGSSRWVVFALAIPTIVLGLFWNPFVPKLSLSESVSASAPVPTDAAPVDSGQ